MPALNTCSCYKKLEDLKISPLNTNFLLGNDISFSDKSHLTIDNDLGKYVIKSGSEIIGHGLLDEQNNEDVLSHLKMFSEAFPHDGFLDVELKRNPELSNEDDMFYNCSSLREFLVIFMDLFSVSFDRIFISGGFVLKFLNRTTEFNDIDIFVNAFNMNIDFDRYFVADISYPYSGLMYFEHPFLNINIISCECLLPDSLSFSIFEMSKFDIPFCKVAFIFDNDDPYLVDLSWSGHNPYGFDSSFFARCLKYSNRICTDHIPFVPKDIDYFLVEKRHTSFYVYRDGKKVFPLGYLTFNSDCFNK